MRFACLVIACLPGLAQTPRVSFVTKARGEKVTLEISADSQPARAPMALKWEVVFPVQMMKMEGDTPEIGRAALDSSKELECKKRSPYRYVCILSGGRNAIQNGAIASFHFSVLTTAEAGSTSLKIEKAEATTVDSKKWVLNDTEAIVIIK